MYPRVWPFAQSELSSCDQTFIDRVFASGVEGLLAYDSEPAQRNDYLDIICRGGYPEVQGMTTRARRRWFRAYLRTVLDREIETSRDIRDREALEAAAHLFAGTTAQELVMANLAQRLSIDRETAGRYQPWLERVFLIQRVPGWGRGLVSKVVLRPKVYMVDTGLAAGLAGKDEAALRRPTEPATGPLVETLVAGEITRQLSWGDAEAGLFHLRESGGRDVDLVVEATDGRVIGVEVKATTAPRTDDFKGLAYLRDRLENVGVPFVAGVVLHTGAKRLPFGDKMVALPISDLWR